MQIQDRLISEIKSYPQNAKEHTATQVKQIANSIKAFGFNQPIVVDKEGVIIVGHGRYFAAQSLNIGTVPVLEIDIDEEKAKSYRLADNKLNESSWKMDIVIDELKTISLEMLDLTGFDRDLIIESDAKDDDIPNLPIEPKSKLGDIYLLGDHRVMCGDSTKQEDVDKLMKGKKADMAFTDPPYGVDYTGKTKESLKIENDKELKTFPQALKFMKVIDGGAVYICCPSANLTHFDLAFRKYCHYSCTIIWNKNSMVLGRGDYHWKHEPILYGWKLGGTHKFYGGRNQTTVWDIPRSSRSESHPTMKPIELIVKAITNSSKGEDLILDLFLGSGSTLIAAEKTERICYGMDIDPKYVDVIIKRWEDYTGKKAEKLSPCVLET